ncbi:sirohydrochlorin cobaltochelatase [Clostridium sp. HCS.1]|uniref:sirohydrochlorin cobaltochelatase n=1 Tax=Clostridium sp. HCS.1 TaxID=3238594 RepID=UPI003A10316C
MSKAIIIVSFGTSNLEGLKVIEDFENEIREYLNERYKVCKAFTSSSISNILFNKHGKIVPRLEEALFNLSNEGYTEVYIQPLHIIEGSEYMSILKIIKEYNYSFSKLTLGKVIMGNNKEELIRGCNLIVDSMEKELNKDGNIVLVGHGSRTIDVASYNYLKHTFIEKGFKRVFVGTLEGENKKDNILKELLYNEVEEVSIVPILMLPGNHIVRDIFGESDSWQSLFIENNIKVSPVKKSLLEYSIIKEFYLNLISSNIR